MTSGILFALAATCALIGLTKAFGFWVAIGVYGLLIAALTALDVIIRK